MKLNRRLAAAAIFATINIALAVTAVQVCLGADLTMEETAQILVHDLDFGGRASDSAIKYGDAILPLIRKESHDFHDLNNRNSFWIADVLGSIRTQQSRTMLEDLYSRKYNIAKLTGAVGLAHQGIFPDGINEKSFLVSAVSKGTDMPLTPLSEMKGVDPSETELAVVALGYSKNEKVLPCLIHLLKTRPFEYGCHASTCQAIARIKSPKAIPVLRDCLVSNKFYALPDAFRALITLGDSEAVSLSISRITPEIKGYNSGFVVDELKTVTGQDFGFDRQKWTNWWNSAKATWRIPEKFTLPWDEQEHLY